MTERTAAKRSRTLISSKMLTGQRQSALRRTQCNCGKERLNGIQEVDGSTPFSSTPSVEREMSHGWRMACVLACLAGALFLAPGCATQQRPGPGDHSRVERPAHPLEEEEGLSDKIGQVGVVVLIVVVTVGGILIPIILLGAL